MKKLVIVSGLLLLSAFVFSQSDTLYLRQNKKIACKISEVNDSEIKYKLASNMEGPNYVIDKSTVTKYSLSNGFTELIVPDEMSIEHEHEQILGNRRVIKISPFSFAFSHISLSYESVIKVGMNLDVELGYINSGINPQYKGINVAGANNSLSNSGFYFKPGIKFFLGQDYSVKGLKYAHPLKGRYIRLDLAVSYINFKDLSGTYYAYNSGNPTTQTITSNLNTLAYGGFVNYGHQFILGNILTMDYYFGFGFTAQTISYSNPDFLKNTTNQYGYNAYNENNYTASYHGFLRVPVVGLSFTSGFRIGYILPDNKKNKRQPVKQ